jgi:hypothetical protein
MRTRRKNENRSDWWLTEEHIGRELRKLYPPADTPPDLHALFADGFLGAGEKDVAVNFSAPKPGQWPGLFVTPLLARDCSNKARLGASAITQSIRGAASDHMPGYSQVRGW